jgi:hypothetical protein
MKSKSSFEWLKACGGTFQELTSRGFKSKLHTMDNEASSAFKSYFTEIDMSYQLGPSHCHCLGLFSHPLVTFCIDICPKAILFSLLSHGEDYNFYKAHEKILTMCKKDSPMCITKISK